MLQKLQAGSWPESQASQGGFLLDGGSSRVGLTCVLTASPLGTNSPTLGFTGSETPGIFARNKEQHACWRVPIWREIQALSPTKPRAGRPEVAAGAPPPWASVLYWDTGCPWGCWLNRSAFLIPPPWGRTGCSPSPSCSHSFPVLGTPSQRGTCAHSPYSQAHQDVPEPIFFP